MTNEFSLLKCINHIGCIQCNGFSVINVEGGRCVFRDMMRLKGWGLFGNHFSIT